MGFVIESHDYGYHHVGVNILDRYNGILQRNEDNIKSEIHFENERDAVMFILGLV